MAKDIYNSIGRFERRLESLKQDKKINPNNKEWFLLWLEKKRKEFEFRKGLDHSAKIRYYKTLDKYITLLKKSDEIFHHKDMRLLNELDMQKAYISMESGEFNIAKSTRRDFYNKIFKSDPFEYIEKREIARKVFKLESDESEDVRFFTKEDLDSMANFSTSLRNKLFLYFLFDSGVRIGTALNIKFGDCKLRHNTKTKRDYYMIIIRKDYTKSKRDRHIPLLLNETIELLKIHKQGKRDQDLLFDFGYTNSRMLISRVSEKAKIRTQPDNLKISIHDFRRSCGSHLLSKGYSIDFIKARLGHKPSSAVIDRYVSYLGLKDDEAIKLSQDLEYNQLSDAYKETVEKLNVLNSNQRQMEEQIKKLILDQAKKRTEV